MSIIFRNTDSNNEGEVLEAMKFADANSALMYKDSPIAVCPDYFREKLLDASLTYAGETGYYYLFLTCGTIGEDSHVIAARSREEGGPYLDHRGIDLADAARTNEPAGFLFLSSFYFDDEDGINSPSRGYLWKSGEDYRFTFMSRRTDKDAENRSFSEYCFPVVFSEDGWPLLCPGNIVEKSENEEENTNDIYTLKELQGFYECVSLRPSLPQEAYSSNFVALLPNTLKGIMSMQTEDWSYPIPDYANGRVELGGSVRGFYHMEGSELVLDFAHDRVALKTCTAIDASNGFPTIFLVGKSQAGIEYMLKKITLPHPNHYFRQ